MVHPFKMEPRVSRGGVYRHLRDKSAPWRERLKLARCAWKHDCVFLLNKQQLILDWLTFSLSTRKSIHAEEVPAIWQTMRDLLQTRKCRRYSPGGQTPVLKIGFFQVLLSELSSMATGDPRGHLNEVIAGCCLSLMTSARLSSAVSGKFDFLLQLLSSCTEVCNQQLTLEHRASTTFTKLLQAALEKYEAAQRQKSMSHLVIQQVASRLLLPVVRLRWLAEVDDVGGAADIRDTATALCDVLFAALFDSQLTPKYDLFLHLCDEGGDEGSSGSSGSSRPKYIEGVFTSLEAELKKTSSSWLQDAGHKAALKFIPLFFQSFVEHHRGSDKTRLGLALCRFLCKLVGVLAPLSAPRGRAVLPCVGALLDTLVLEGVYEEGEDVKGVTAEWLRGVACWLLSTPFQGTPATFRCLHGLLRLSHRVVEPQLADILADACQPSLSPEAAPVRDAFLCDLVATYDRLQRLPHLVLSLLKSVRVAAGTTRCLVWPLPLLSRLSRALVTQQQTTSVQMLESFLDEFCDAYHPAEDAVSPPGCDAGYQLFSEVLNHLALVDYSITQHTATRVRHCMQKIVDCVLQPSISMSLSKEQLPLHFSSLLQVAHSWSRLRVLLARYAGWPPGGATDGAQLRLVHPYLDDDQWRRLVAHAGTTADKRISYQLHCLQVQSLCARRLFADVPLAAPPSTEDVVVALLRVVSGQSEAAGVWDGQASSIDLSSYGVAIWRLLCRHCNDLFRCHGNSRVERHRLFAFTSQLFTSLNGETVGSELASPDSVSMATVSIDMATGELFLEMRSLHTAFLTVAISRLSFVINSSSNLVKLLDRLSSQQVDWQKNVKEMTTLVAPHLPSPPTSSAAAPVVLRDVCKNLNEMFLRQDVAESMSLHSDVREIDLVRCLERLRWLPLQWLSLADRLRCSLLLWLLLGAAGRHRSSLLCAISRCLLLVLTGDGVLSPLHVGHLASWLADLQLKVTGQEAEQSVGRLLEVVLKVSSRSEVALDQLQVFVAKVATSIESASGREATADMTETASGREATADMTETASGMEATANMTETASGREATAELMDDDEAADDIVSSMVSLRTLVTALSCFNKAMSTTNQKSAVWRRLDEYRASLVQCLLGYVCAAGTRALSRSPDVSASVLRGVSVSLGQGDAPRLLTLSTPLCLHWLGDNGAPSSVVGACLLFISAVCRADPLSGALRSDFLAPCSGRLLHMLAHPPRPVATPGGTMDGPQAIPGTKRVNAETRVTGGSPDGDDTRVTDDTRVIDDAANQAVMIEQTFIELTTTLSLETFSRLVSDILDSVDLAAVTSDPSKLCISLALWRPLLEAAHSDDAVTLLIAASQKLLLKIATILIDCRHGDSSGHLTVTVAALNAVTGMLSTGKALATTDDIMLALTCAVVAPSRDRSVAHFQLLFTATYRLLNELLVQHPAVVCECVPPFIAAMRRLLTLLITNGCQTIEKRNEDDISRLVSCARLIDRLFSLVTTHKLEFCKVACYLVADYITQVQQVTLLPPVKKAILHGIYKLLELCDSHSVALLQAVLPVGTRGLFSALYYDYTKHYKYSGHV